MCGIHFQVGLKESSSTWGVVDKDTLAALRARGPDICSQSSFDLDDEIRVCYTATVLSLREPFQPQPVIDSTPGSDGSLLLWNGEAWKIDHAVVTGNDSRTIFAKLQQAALLDRHDRKPLQECQSHVQHAISQVEGPFAFVFVDKLNNRIYFGRDSLGRRSLLVRCTSDSLAISSVDYACRQERWVELDAKSVFALELGPSSPAIQDTTSLPAWKHVQDFIRSTSFSLLYRPHCTSYPLRLNRSVPLPEEVQPLALDSEAVLQLETLLSAAVAVRVQNIYQGPNTSDAIEDSIRVAVLFSGGLDCTVLARLLHEHLAYGVPVDLLNVAFENPRKVRLKQATHAEPAELNVLEHSSSEDAGGDENHRVIAGVCYDECPDRITAEAAYAELLRLCPQRDWRLVKINVPYSTAVKHRDNVKRLIFPRATVMDLDIGRALYFASRGIGQVQSKDGSLIHRYTSSARVLLSGLGADELFGGYQHHARSFLQRGFEGLFDSLEADIDNIADRNLGRDDRVLSHWGRETRFPYLDESIVAWAKRTPVWEKCGYSEPEIGHTKTPNQLSDDKLVLRMLALKLGMASTATQPKRAIQFGARTAKMDAGKVRGTDAI